MARGKSKVIPSGINLGLVESGRSTRESERAYITENRLRLKVRGGTKVRFKSPSCSAVVDEVPRVFHGHLTESAMVALCARELSALMILRCFS